MSYFFRESGSDSDSESSSSSDDESLDTQQEELKRKDRYQKKGIFRSNLIVFPHKSLCDP
jgi:hypothetical protein